MTKNYQVKQNTIQNIENHSSFEFFPDEPEISYAQIPKDLIRSRDISPECIHLIIYILSNNEDDEIDIDKLIKRYEGQWSKNKVFKLIEEAKKSSYLKKKTITKDSEKPVLNFLGV